MYNTLFSHEELPDLVSLLKFLKILTRMSQIWVVMRSPHMSALMDAFAIWSMGTANSGCPTCSTQCQWITHKTYIAEPKASLCVLPAKPISPPVCYTALCVPHAPSSWSWAKAIHTYPPLFPFLIRIFIAWPSRFFPLYYISLRPSIL